jgi:O-antigen/teichoic acid export membrane protein
MKERLITLLRQSERYTKTDMVYLVRTGFWGNAGIITASLFGLGLYIVFGRYLTQAQYGIYQYLLTISVFINAFTFTGMNSAVTRSVAQGYEGVFQASVRLQLRWSVLPFLLSVATAGYYALNGNTTLAIGILVLGIFTPLANAFNTYAAFLIGKLDVRRAFFYNFAANIPYYAGIALAAIFFRAAIPVLIVNGVLNTAVLYGCYRATLASQRPNDKVDPAAPAYGKHLSLMNVPLIILGSLDSLLAFHYLGASGLALYSFATAIPDQLGKLTKFLPTVALPKFSISDEKMLRASMGRKLLQITFAGAVLACLYLLIAPLIFRLLFPQYVEVVPFSRLYALSMLTLGTGILTAALTAKGRVRELYIFNIGTSAAQTVIQLIGVISGGLVGLIIGKVIGGALSLAAAAVLFFFSRDAASPEGANGLPSGMPR